jgi:hypothetical protein
MRFFATPRKFPPRLGMVTKQPSPPFAGIVDWQFTRRQHQWIRVQA